MLSCNVTHQRFNADKCVTERWKIIESVSICVTSNCSSIPHIFFSVRHAILGVSFRILGKKQVIVLRMFCTSVKDILYPTVRNPLSKYVCHCSNKYILPLFQLVQCAISVYVQCRFKPKWIYDRLSILIHERFIKDKQISLHSILVCLDHISFHVSTKTE